MKDNGGGRSTDTRSWVAGILVSPLCFGCAPLGDCRRRLVSRGKRKGL